MGKEESSGPAVGRVGLTGSKVRDRRVWIAAALLAVAVVLPVGGWLVTRNDGQPKEEPAAAKLSAAEKQNADSDFESEAASLQAYLDTKPPKEEADKATVKLAAAYLNNKDYDNAIATYKTLEADTASPMRQSVLKGLADTYAVKGDKENAIRYYEQLIAYIDGQGKTEGYNRQRAYAERQLEKLRRD